MWTNYLFTVTGITSELCGECFFVYAQNQSEAELTARIYFPGEKLHFLGKYSDYEADCLGYDTY